MLHEIDGPITCVVTAQVISRVRTCDNVLADGDTRDADQVPVRLLFFSGNISRFRFLSRNPAIPRSPVNALFVYSISMITPPLYCIELVVNLNNSPMSATNVQVSARKHSRGVGYQFNSCSILRLQYPKEAPYFNKS